MKKITIMLLVLTSFAFFAGCGDNSSDSVNNKIIPGLSENPDIEDSEANPGSTEMMNDEELDSATFVDIDFDAFPKLPEYKVPDSDVIFVAKNGNDTSGDGSESQPFKTISKGLDEASPGDTIVVRQGVYEEVVESGDYRGVIIQKDNITLMGYPEETIEIIPASYKVTYGMIIKSDNFVMRGLTIRDFPRIGILLAGDVVTNTVIADVKVANAREGISCVRDSDGMLIYNVKITGVETIGLHCGNGRGTDWRVENTKIEIMSGGSGSGADAFAIENGDNILLVNSEFTGASADGIDTKATRVLVYGCYVHDIHRNGIKLWNGGDIINTLVHHTGADASIVVEEGEKTRILHSIIAYHNYNGSVSYNMTFGYDTHPDSEYEITNSIIYNTSGGAYFSPNSTLTITNSLMFGMENGIILVHNGTTVNIADGAAGLNQVGAGNFVEDPLLDSSYHLKPGSPGINAGVITDNNYPAEDANGNLRVQNEIPDLGPFETTM